ncbi:T9SS type A sorting domain-containing protein [Williamwhitmania taraxaci]|uniref:Por secretion system C-terminal sorting domain-containing protein n=1 Tax=Williamwhitmania taraxaci TaxID=1640674 RepID=A0A1G6RTC6_9BACT|nr:T9SS type A sorting domain-containing protein [Williamwhitmania taraxaci]SDD07683.1 Por secretion system C-terminal sorting domain-containing protein [Williamwhitmania taraxaci]
MKKLYNLLTILILLVSFAEQTKAQEQVEVEVQIVDYYMFDDGGSGTSGDNYTVKYFQINNSSRYTEPAKYNYKGRTYKYLATLTGEKLTLSVVYAYRYYWWNLYKDGGTESDDTQTVEFTLSDAIGKFGKVEKATFKVRENWYGNQPSDSITLRIRINPIKVTAPSEKHCVNEPITLSTFKGLTPSSGVSFKWQYNLVETYKGFSVEFLEWKSDLLPQIEMALREVGSDDDIKEQIIADVDFCSYVVDNEAANAKLQSMLKLYSGKLSNAAMQNVITTFYYYLQTRPDPTLGPHKVTPQWKDLAVSNGKETEASLASIATSINELRKIDFRVQAIYGSVATPFSTIPCQRDLLPMPPSVTISSSTNACPNTGGQQGTVSFSVSSLVNDSCIYRIVDTKIGYYANIDDANYSVGAYGEWKGMPKEVPQNGICYVSGLKPGNYKLLVTYRESALRNCYGPQEFSIGTHPDFSFTTSIEDAKCPENFDGSITVNAISCVGDPVYKCFYNNTDYLMINNVASGLSKGVYTISVTDGCQEKTDKVTITAPAPVTVAVSDQINPTCTSNPNGMVTVAATGGNGSTYSFNLVNIDSKEIYTPTDKPRSWTPTNLSSGTYKVYVNDPDHSGCEAAKAEFKLDAATPLSISKLSDSKTTLNCSYSNDGSIGVSGSGGSGYFTYTLQTNNIVKTAATDNEAWFVDITVGSYTVVMTNSGNTCTDHIDLPVEITAPAAIESGLTAIDVTCFEAKDGMVSAVVTGGVVPVGVTPPYILDWEKMLDGDWSSISRSGAFIDKLDRGTFRIKVADANSCFHTSGAISVLEPTLLRIGEPTITDIRCFGEKGKVETAAIGGNEGYRYLLSSNGGVDFLDYTSGSDLTPATYSLKVIDKKGCEDSYASPISITAPDSPLDFSFTKLNFNGYSVSCYGNTNGAITLTPSGGNSATYSGYWVSLNEGNFSENMVCNKLGAGSYRIRLKDARGCEVEHATNLTQPATELFLTAKRVVDVKCLNDTNGEIYFGATGGAKPYSFKLGQGIPTPDSTFTGLASGSYTAAVTDVNGCAIDASTSLGIRIPPMKLSGTLTNIGCFGDRSGAILLGITGGIAPQTIKWEGLSQTAALVDNLPKGDYKVSVVDAEGCGVSESYSLTQPDAPLSMQLHSTPLCPDKTSGFVEVKAHGGTPPYLYKLNSGDFASSSTLIASNGLHSVTLLDDHLCETSAAVEVKKKEGIPTIDFMVATSRYATDTLVVKEISIPKPDSLFWKFDPLAIMISDNPWSPMVRFEQAGTYAIEMIGYFDGCDFYREKRVEIAAFDPHIIPENPLNRGIREMQVLPNPSDGAFQLILKLYVKQQVMLVIADMSGRVVYSNKLQGDSFTESINLGSVNTGSYVLKAICDYDVRNILLSIVK